MNTSEIIEHKIRVIEKIEEDLWKTEEAINELQEKIQDILGLNDKKNELKKKIEIFDEHTIKLETEIEYLAEEIEKAEVEENEEKKREKQKEMEQLEIELHKTKNIIKEIQAKIERHVPRPGANQKEIEENEKKEIKNKKKMIKQLQTKANEMYKEIEVLQIDLERILQINNETES